MAMPMPMVDDHYCSPSIKAKLKSSICCFRSNNDDLNFILQADDARKPYTPRSPYSWLKSTAHDLEIKDMCRGLIGRKAKNRKRHNSADFKYDAASYSLNFENDKNKEDELPLNNFTARLPTTPERPPEEKWVAAPQVVAPTRRELLAWS